MCTELDSNPVKAVLLLQDTVRNYFNRSLLRTFALQKKQLPICSVTQKISLSHRTLPHDFLPWSRLREEWLPPDFTRRSEK